MNHPPIPPNCKFFTSFSNILERECFIFDCMDVFEWPIDDSAIIPGDSRIIISSVARCAWEDEASKFGIKDERRYECQKSSEAWRLWGLRKE